MLFITRGGLSKRQPFFVFDSVKKSFKKALQFKKVLSLQRFFTDV